MLRDSASLIWSCPGSPFDGTFGLSSELWKTGNTLIPSGNLTRQARGYTARISYGPAHLSSPFFIRRFVFMFLVST